MTDETSRERVQLALKMAAPYLAVGVFWIGFHNGWLALLAYHAQILWWSRGRLRGIDRPRWTPLSLLVLPAALTGPVLYFVLPYIARIDLGAWLVRYQVTGAGLVAMVFYYGLVHPAIEQTHWAPLRGRTPIAHAAFAGYHVLVLYSLLPVPWLAVSFAVLATVSWLWKRLAQESGSLVPAITSHVAADLGMVIVAWMSR